MRRGIRIVLLSLGTVLGFGWGIARVTGYCPDGCDHCSYGHEHFGMGPHRHEGRAKPEQPPAP